MKEHKLAAIVFTDIVGYTKRMEADEEGTMKLLARQRELIFPIVKEYGGEVIKEIGDGLMMMFTSANRAVRFAMAVQDSLKDEELTIRAGIHIGDVIFEKSDVFGSAVNIAARIEPLAPAGGICISEDVRSQIRNQKDIFTVSIGKQELKGVDGSLEIFRIVPEAAYDEVERVPFFKDIWRRRVIQIASLYVILAFLVRLGIAFLVKEYLLSPHLTNLVWFILLSLLPSIMLVSYYHGKRETSRWTKVELVGLPLNILAAFFVLFFVFKGKDLGAITTKITIENEDGERVEKLILKNEYRKSIFIFNMETSSMDSNMIYLQYSLPAMLEYDLAQDLFISAVPAINDFNKMVEAGYPRGVGLPVTLMKQMAEERHANYFVSGTLEKDTAGLVLYAQLYDTRLTKKIADYNIRAENPFSLVDETTIKLKQGMGLPESHISETIDLPVSDIFTNSERALYFFSKAMRAGLEKDWEANLQNLNKAIEEDPNFALTYVVMGISYFQNNDTESSLQSLEMARKHLHKLPERQQFSTKYVYFVLTKQPEKALAVLRMWTELYPNDITAHSTLVQRYVVRNMYEEAIAEFKTIIRLDPERYEMLSSLGDYYFQLGLYDSALVYYEHYKKQLPQQAESYQNLGDYYRGIGEMEMASKYYEDAILLADPSEEHSIKVDLGRTLLHSGKFEESLDVFTEALWSAGRNLDSLSAYNALQDYYLITGQMQRSLEQYELKMEILKRILQPKEFLVYRVMTIEPYILAGKLDEAESILEGVRENLDESIQNIIPFGYLYIYAETGDTAKAREAISEANKLIAAFGEEMLLANIHYIEARINEHLGNYDEAINFYNSCLEMNATTYSFHRGKARCYRLMGDVDDAEIEINHALKFRPYNALNNYEAALIYFDMGKDEEALEYLQRAVDTWKDADPDYDKAVLAKEKLNSINS